MKELYLDNKLFTGTEEEFLAVKEFEYKEWSLNGLLHRTGGPAIIYSDGTQEWFQNGERHRTDGPAVIDSDGSETWFQNELLHRTDGPSFIEISKYGLKKYWYINDEPMSWIDKWFPLSYWICGGETRCK